MNYEQANQLIVVLTGIKDELHQLNTKLDDIDSTLVDGLDDVKTELNNIWGGMP